MRTELSLILACLRSIQAEHMGNSKGGNGIYERLRRGVTKAMVGQVGA
jgi:hypothetical protein